MIRFLETITAFGDDLLIPIDKIQYIKISVEENEQTVIRIIGYDKLFDCAEYYIDDIRASDRFEEIKKIIEAK